MLIFGIIIMVLAFASLISAYCFAAGDWWKNPNITDKLAIVFGVAFIVFGIIGVTIISNVATENNDNVTANESNIVADDSNISAHNSELSVSDSKVVINSDNLEDIVIVDSNGNEYKIVKNE